MRVVVVGAGPAGLNAAAAAREHGASVRLLDAADATGGQYWRHPFGGDGVPDHAALRARLESDPQVLIDLGAHVWAVEQQDDGLLLDVVHGPADGSRRTSERLAADRLVIATGAHDLALPVPGWTLPGVFTAGAAQALAKGERVGVGERVVVAGTGPFLLPVAVALGSVGARVVAVVEAGRASTLARRWLRRPAELARAGGKARELAGYAWHHARRRVPYRTGRAVVAIHGTTSVEAVTVARLDDDWRVVDGSEQRIACDAVCLGHGFVPRLELAVAAGCELTADGFVAVDPAQRTSMSGVLAAGEITGIGGADLSGAEGWLAGWVAAGGSPDDPAAARAQRERQTYRRFARRLAEAHAVGDAWTSWLTDDTVVCRCEEVDLGTLRRITTATGSTGLRSVKLTTRAGLGACQARVCGRIVERLLDLPPGTDRRPVAAPIRLGELAAMHDSATQEEENPS